MFLILNVATKDVVEIWHSMDAAKESLWDSICADAEEMDDYHIIEVKNPTILNTSILTDFGVYHYQQIDLFTAKQAVSKEFNSAVGHKSTCDVLTKLLEVEVPMNRIEYKQDLFEVALVFKLRSRPEEGKILTSEEIESIGYDFGLLRRLA
jgi:hypothetical protein